MLQTLLRSWFPALLGAISLVSCGSLTCGEGTVQQDGVCVVEGAGGDSGFAFEFAGAQAAGPASLTSILVAWLPASEPEVSFNVYLATSKDGFNFAQAQAQVPAGSTTVVVGGLEEEQKYFVIVRAELDGKEQPNDVTVEVTTADDTTPPSFAGVAAAESEEGGAILLSWDAATDDLSPQGALVYFVYAAKTVEDLDLDMPVGVSNPGADRVSVVMPEPETEYVLVVRARDAASNFDTNQKTIKAESGRDVQAPVFSGCKSAAARTASSLVVTWNEASDDIAAPEDISYNLYASETPEGFNFAAPDATVQGALMGLIPSLARATSYFVVCRAVDPSGNEEGNLRIQKATTKSDGEPPVFDGVLTADNITPFTVDLSWNPATDNQSKPANIIYDVFVAEISGDFDFEEEPWVSSPPGATGMTVEGLDPNTNYYFVVLARDEGDNRSEPGDELALATQVSFQVDVLGIFASKQCALACHGGAAPLAGMNLSPAAAYDALVDVASSTALGAGYKRVEVGVPDESHLVHRLKGTGPVEGQPSEARMPQDGNLLSVGQIATIELWISQGAENN